MQYLPGLVAVLALLMITAVRRRVVLGRGGGGAVAKAIGAPVRGGPRDCACRMHSAMRGFSACSPAWVQGRD